MALPTRSVPPRAITASAARMVRRRDRAEGRVTDVGWQQQALQMYDAIGELRFASHFIARMLSRVRYFPAKLGPDGKVEEITSGAPVEILNQLQDPGGGRSQLQYRYGLLQFVVGEGVLFGYDIEEGQRQKWKFLWKEEVKFTDERTVVRLDANRQPTSEVGVGYRMWTPHPRHSDVPDAPVRAILRICDELLALEASVLSTATSRIPNGILLIPTEASPNPQAGIGDEDPEANIFLVDMMEHFQAQIEEPGSPAGAVPFVHEAAYDYIDRVRWMATHDSQNDYLERELRKEAIHRIALGLDMPPEALLGMTDANHWTAKQVMHDMWRSHGVPKSEQFADDLSEAVIRPMLEDAEYPDWENVVIGQDDSQVVLSPDRTEDADKALDRIAIGFVGYRELKGIPEDYAPSDEEKEFLASLKIRQEVQIQDGELIIPQRGPVAQPSTGGDAASGPPEPTAGRNGSRQESRTASSYILGAADLALARCRELAGVRIRHKCKDCAEGQPDSLVASVLGPAQVTDPAKLVQGGTDGFRSFLVEKGIAPTQAAALCQMIEVFARKTLFDSQQPELPPGFVAQVERAKEVSVALVGD